MLELLAQRLRQRSAQHLTRRLREAGSPTAPRQSVDGQQRLLFCSNDYLGLANHPQVVEALREGASRWGAGAGGSALISGYSAPHRALEARLAAWAAPHIPGAGCLSFGTGYLANLAVVSALGLEGAALFCEALNHASLIDGARLARAEKHIYRSVPELRAQLEACRAPHKLIVSDAVFSMDGHLAPLPELLALAEQHGALLVVDDAHGLGVLGQRGHGSLSHFGLRSERLVWMGTLGKAAGVAGAFVAAHPTVVEWLLQTARPYIFTTAAPPLLAHALLTSLDLIEGEEGERRRDQLDLLRTRLREGLAPLCAARSWRLPQSSTPIQPVIVGENEAALHLAAQLETRGLRVPAIRPPTVPAGTARLRITLCAAHELSDVDELLRALESG